MDYSNNSVESNQQFPNAISVINQINLQKLEDIICQISKTDLNTATRKFKYNCPTISTDFTSCYDNTNNSQLSHDKIINQPRHPRNLIPTQLIANKTILSNITGYDDIINPSISENNYNHQKYINNHVTALSLLNLNPSCVHTSGKEVKGFTLWGPLDNINIVNNHITNNLLVTINYIIVMTKIQTFLNNNSPRLIYSLLSEKSRELTIINLHNNRHSSGLGIPNSLKQHKLQKSILTIPFSNQCLNDILSQIGSTYSFFIQNLKYYVYNQKNREIVNGKIPNYLFFNPDQRSRNVVRILSNTDNLLINNLIVDNFFIEKGVGLKNDPIGSFSLGRNNRKIWATAQINQPASSTSNAIYPFSKTYRSHLTKKFTKITIKNKNVMQANRKLPIENSSVVGSSKIHQLDFNDTSGLKLEASKYRHIKDTHNIVGFVVNVHDATNFDIDFTMHQSLHALYHDVISNKYSYKDFNDLEFNNFDITHFNNIILKTSTTYRCRLRGVGINQKIQHTHSWKQSQISVDIKQLIDRTDGWVICTLSDVDVYKRLLVDITIPTIKPLDLCSYILEKMKSELNPIFYPYSHYKNK